MHAPAETHATYRDMMRIVFRHKKKAIFFVLFMCVVTLAVALFWPKTYQSQVKLFVKLGKESVTLDPTATTSNTLQVQASRDSEINSVLDMLQGRELSEKVVDRQGVETVMSVPPENVWFDQIVRAMRKLKVQVRDFAKSTIQPDIDRSKQGDELALEERELAVELLEDSVIVRSPKNSSVITLTAEAQSPQAAQKIASDWIAAYFDEHIRANRTPGSLKLFAHQTELIEQELVDANRELADLKNRAEMVTVAGQMKLLEDQKLEIEAEQLRVGRQIKAGEASLATLDKTLADLDKFVLMEREEGHSNEAADRMRELLYKEQIEELAVEGQFSKDHPLWKQKQEQLAQLQKVFDQGKDPRTHSKFTTNPNWQKLQLDMLDQSVQLANLKSTDQKLGEQRNGIVDNIQKANLYVLNIGKLERQVDVLEISYRSYADHLEQARINDAIELQRISNVNVVQDATFEPEPLRPKAILVLPAGLLVAMFGAVGLALFSEYLDPRLHTVADVEKAAGLPVLIAIPNLPQAQIVKRRVASTGRPRASASAAAM